MRIHHLAAVTLLTGLATAQVLFLPDNSAITQPSSSSTGWRSSTTGFRAQWIYDTSHFTNQGIVGPVLMTRLRFRAANNSTSAGGQYAGDGITTGVNVVLGYSKNDYTSPSTTYALNEGPLQQVMANGTVTVATGAGTTPNNYVIDITIPGGFFFDPALGMDLLVEVDGPAFTGTLPVFATGVSLAASRCTRISSTGQNSATGSITTGFGTQIMVNFIGAGGTPTDANGDPISLIQAAATAYGTGCPNESRSFGEEFPAGTATTLDLGTGIRLSPDVPFAPTRYTVTSGAAATFFPIGTTALLSNATTPGVLGDDAMSQACTLPFAFPFPGGSTTVVHANTNGYIVLGPTTATGGDFTPSLTDMVGATTGTHAGLPRLFPVWYDFVANRNVSVNATAGLYFDVDVANQKAYLTWNDVGDISNGTAGAISDNFQVELSADGSVEFRYGAMAPFASTVRTKIVGFSPGVPSPAPASRDLSATMPFLTNAADVAAVTLAGTAPILGATMTLTTGNVPAAPGGILNFISGTQFNPGIDLTVALGMPGCSAYMDPNAAIVTNFALGSPDASLLLPIPLDITLSGVDVYSQSAAFDPGRNALGVTLSNGLTLHFGTVL